MLARIDRNAPPDILFRARFLRAGLLQAEGSWAEAAKLWEAVRADRRWVTVDAGKGPLRPGRVLPEAGAIHRGDCGMGSGSASRGGDEGQAAALGVAELRLAGDNPSATLEAFEAALRGVAGSADYRNAIVDLQAVRTLIEAGCQALRQVAAPSRRRNRWRRCTSAWPCRASVRILPARRQRHGASHYGTRPRPRKATVPNGWRKKLGNAIAKPAWPTRRPRTWRPIPRSKADRLWHSANDYLEGRDHARVVHVLDRMVRLPISLERQGKVWFVLGEAHMQLNDRDNAQTAYQKCIEYPGPHAYRARYELAVSMIGQKNWEDAEAHLKQNLSLMQAAPDPEAHEKTLVTLADLLFRHGSPQAAFLHLQEALDRYPNNPRSRQLRLEYALTCRRLAEQLTEAPPGTLSIVDTRMHIRAERLKYLDMARDQYQKLVEDLNALQEKQALTNEEEAIVRQARFAVADCQFDLGRYAPALEIYSDLGRRYQNQVEGLIALRHVWQCHGMMDHPAKARAALDQVRATIPSTKFDATAENRTRAYWEGWVSEQTRLRDAMRGPVE